MIHTGQKIISAPKTFYSLKKMEKCEKNVKTSPSYAAHTQMHIQTCIQKLNEISAAV